MQYQQNMQQMQHDMVMQFQQAKLKFEAALQDQSDMTYSIVRPTAFFKSVSGQLEVVQSGAPFVMFGDGKVSEAIRSWE